MVRRLLRLSAATTVPAPALSRVPPPDCAFELEAALERFGRKRGPWLCSLREFCSTYRNFGEAFPRLVRATDKGAACDQLHALTGVAGMLGAAALARDAQALEQALHDGEDVAILLEPMLDDLEAALRTFGAELRVHGDPDHSGTVRIPVNEVDIVPQLQRLSAMLSACDMGAMELFQSLSPTLQGMDAQWQARLDGALARLDFVAANDACAALQRKVAS